MSELESPANFREDETAEWCNQVGIDSYRNGSPCLVESGLIFFEGINSRTGEMDFGFGYNVQDAEGLWFAFPWELRKRLRPGPDWGRLCHLDPPEVQGAVQKLMRCTVRARCPKVLGDSVS